MEERPRRGLARGDWGAPKSHARNATIAIIKTVWKRLQRIKNLTVQVRAGTEVRSYAVVKVLIIWFF